MLRRLHQTQPESFAFTPANLEWAQGQITKFPVGRQASAIIPLLTRAQEQEGWLTRPAIEYVADLLDMPYIRALEVATFYFMFQLAPVGSVAHFQICGTTSCMICGAEDLMQVCKDKIAPNPHELSADGKFSWEEVECLGACSNAPMAQIGKDYYEDLTVENFSRLIDEMAAGKTPRPGSQIARFSSEPASGPTSLAPGADKQAANGSVQRALDIGDTLKRIDGTEVPLKMPWQISGQQGPIGAMGAGRRPMSAVRQAAAETAGKAAAKPAEAAAGAIGRKPGLLSAPRDGKADNLQLLKGVGPKLEAALNALGVYHFDQIIGWSEAELAWVDANLEGYRGRASRDDWAGQARLLAGKD